MKPNRHVHHALLAYLRHEFCTPINGMMSYSELLLEALQTQQETTWFGDLQKIYRCSKQLLTLVTVILDPNQLETGNNPIDGDLNRFGSTLRMELLTLLSTIVGYCEMLLEEAPAELIPDLDKLNALAQHLLSLTNDISNFVQQQLHSLNAQANIGSNLLLEDSTARDDRVQSANRLSQLALAASPPEKPQSVSPDAALQRLLEGNQRFVNEACQNLQQSRLLTGNSTRSRLEETATAQYPFASILGCADSRAPTEIIFDQGVGDLFVVRVAGNIASQTVIGSLEFATSVLGTQLIVVVGHSGCGAVEAAVKGELLPGRISGFVEDIKPLVARVKDKTGDLIENTVIANVQYQAQKLAESSTILANLIQADKLKVVGGQYDLRTGKFTIAT
jgi:carbonic anhydrase